VQQQLSCIARENGISFRIHFHRKLFVVVVAAVVVATVVATRVTRRVGENIAKNENVANSML
jgi:hypothetical protein